MKLATFSRNGTIGFGPIEGSSVIDISSTVDAPSLKELIAQANFPEVVAEASGKGANPYKLSDISLLPPIPDPTRIICIGLNYCTHIAEMGREPGEYPAIFFRYPDSIVGHGEPLLRPRVSDQFDYEGEFAIIIGTGGRYIPRDSALDHVAGYTCFNDGSIRDFQRHTHQFGAGKNFYRSGSCGPWLVSRDALSNVGAQTLTTRLNGTVMQQAQLDDLLFDTAHLVSYLSQIFPLLPGDIIATGTTGGVGAARKPPVWMKPGDTVEVEISAIGTLTNTIADEQA